MAIHDVVEDLTTLRVLHNEVQLLRRLDDFVELDDVRVADHFEDVYFAGHSFNVVDILDLVFLKNFDCDLLSSEIVHSQFDLTEGALADGLAQNVLAHVGAVGDGSASLGLRGGSLVGRGSRRRGRARGRRLFLTMPSVVRRRSRIRGILRWLRATALIGHVRKL